MFMIVGGAWHHLVLCDSLLTPLPLDKMAAIVADDLFRCIFVNEKFCILIKISLKFVHKGLINNNPALV